MLRKSAMLALAAVAVVFEDRCTAEMAMNPPVVTQ